MSSVQPSSCKPILRWAGSKRKQLARLVPFWNDSHKRYVEPFAGSACLFFRLAPPAAILGDLNPALIEFYRVVRDEPERLYRRLLAIPRDSESYYRWRSKDATALDKETRALRFIYLNRNCFNGIYRTNAQGNFNVPFGVDPGAYFTKEDLLQCSRLLQNATLVSGDFVKCLEHVGKGDLVYLDPPYAVQTRRVFREYSIKSFRTADLERFSKCLDSVASSGASFVVSYADCKEARGLAKKWNSRRVWVRRHIAGFTDSRRKSHEWIISNAALPPESD